MGSDEVNETDPGSADPAGSDLPDLQSTRDRTIVDLSELAPFVSLGRYRYLEAHQPLPAQKHASLLVLVLPIRGTFDFVLDDETVPIGPGTALLIRPGVSYRTGVNAETRGELLWLVARARDTYADLATEAPGDLDTALRMLGASDQTVWPSPGAGLDLLVRALEGDDTDQWFINAWRRQLCGAAVVELLSDQRRASFREIPVHAGIRRAQRWIDEHLTESIGVRELVEVSKMSSTHFYQQFAQAVGTSPKDYVLRRKIEQAERLLSDRERSVTSVAHELGFSSSQHFGTAFRRYVGMTPSSYRRALHGETQTRTHNPAS
jgi:AraC-like DNA-binding protein